MNLGPPRGIAILGALLSESTFFRKRLRLRQTFCLLMNILFLLGVFALVSFAFGRIAIVNAHTDLIFYLSHLPLSSFASLNLIMTTYSRRNI